MKNSDKSQYRADAKQPEKKARQPKKPTENRLPVNARTYVKRGKRVGGYKRHRMGEKPEEGGK